jgi:phage FluMu protein Com
MRRIGISCLEPDLEESLKVIATHIKIKIPKIMEKNKIKIKSSEESTINIGDKKLKIKWFTITTVPNV